MLPSLAHSWPSSYTASQGWVGGRSGSHLKLSPPFCNSLQYISSHPKNAGLLGGVLLTIGMGLVMGFTLFVLVRFTEYYRAHSYQGLVRQCILMMVWTLHHLLCTADQGLFV